MESRLELVITGIVALVLLTPLATIPIIETLQRQPLSEPVLLAGLGGAVVGFYFGGRATVGTARQMVNGFNAGKASNGPPASKPPVDKAAQVVI